MKAFIALLGCVTATQAGFVPSSSGWAQGPAPSSPSGWQPAPPTEASPSTTGWGLPQGSEWPSSSSGLEAGWAASSGWQPSASEGAAWSPAPSPGWESGPVGGWMPPQAPMVDEKAKLLIVKDQQRHGDVGRSVTVAGPTHLIKTVHHVQTVDNGGQILSKTGGSGHRGKQVVVLRSVSPSELKHAQVQGWPEQMNSGWQSRAGW